MLDRRNVLLAGASALAFPFINADAATAFYGGDASVQPSGFWEQPRWIWIKRPETGEEIKLVYWRDGQLIREAYLQASWFFRDVRFEKMLARKDPRIAAALKRGQIQTEHLSPWVHMEPVLLDIVYAYCAWLRFYGVDKALIATSGFRHLITNLMTEGAAKDSWHLKGGAADIIVPGVKPQALARFGLWLAGGGVGLYASRGFIHVDRGRVRSWTG